MKFSIVMSAYKPWNLTEHAIWSVVLQSYHSWELIVVSDGPTTGDVHNIIKQASFEVPGRIKLHQVSRVEGAHGNMARNAGVYLAQGEYICWVNHDNVLFPDYLLAHYENFEKHPNCVSLVRCEVISRGIYLGLLPKSEMKVGAIDLMNFAMPTSKAREIDAFCEARSHNYAEDYEIFMAAQRTLPIVRNEKRWETPVGIHF